MAQEPTESPVDLMTAVDAVRTPGLSSDRARMHARNGRLYPAVQTVRDVRVFRRADVDRMTPKRRVRSPNDKQGTKGAP